MKEKVYAKECYRDLNNMKQNATMNDPLAGVVVEALADKLGYTIDKDNNYVKIKTSISPDGRSKS